ncbi:SMI1/KNR4 family protein [Streptomyces sp. NPDC059637]|uniref:SMI1/KNR4 family protein n=1 Tax=Streptomyces sp. NPDC059637 TaxID=3347752 RepID=UPI0036B894E2
MTTGRPGAPVDVGEPPNAAYAGQVVYFPDPVRSARHPDGVQVDEDGYPDFTPYARAAAEVAAPPDGFGIDELRLTDYVSANVACARDGNRLWAGLPAVATPHGWTWHHVAGTRRMELIPCEVKSLLRHHAGLATSAADHGKRGTRPLQETRPVHFRLSGEPVAVTEEQVCAVEESLGHRLPGAYRTFLKAAGGRAPAGVALDPGLGLLLDQPFFTVRREPAVDDLVYANKCLRDHLTKDYLGVCHVQGGLLALKVKGRDTGTVWFCPHDDARDRDGMPLQERMEALLLPCGADFDEFLLRLTGNPPELDTVANLMVDGGFARSVPTGV